MKAVRCTKTKERSCLGINLSKGRLQIELLCDAKPIMSEINPYAPENSESINDSPKRGKNSVCPLCSFPVLRSRFLTSGISVVCSGCGTRLVLSTPWYFPLILLHTVLILAASIWMLSEITGYNAKPFFLFIPLVVIMVVQWMQWKYGKVTVRGGQIVDDE